MLVDHMPPPVVLPGKRLAALSGKGALWLGAVVLARLEVLVVDVTVQVRLCAESHDTAGVRALVGPVMVTLVVAGRG
jgi:hypothetical protein